MLVCKMFLVSFPTFLLISKRRGLPIRSLLLFAHDLARPDFPNLGVQNCLLEFYLDNEASEVLGCSLKFVLKIISELLNTKTRNFDC